MLFLSQISNAQTVSKGRESVKATVNFSERAAYFKAHPQPKLQKPLFDEDDEDEHRPSRPAVNRALVHRHIHTDGHAALGSHGPDLPAVPVVTDSFESTPSDLTGIPPDTHGAIDSQYCVTAINTAVHIQTRGGANVSDISLDEFWTPVLTLGPGSFDPRVHYDPYYKRWIMVGDAYGETGSSQIMVAVSVTSDPTGSWNMYAVPVDLTGASWLDFPNVGFNKKWIVVAGNMFPNTSSGTFGAVVYAFDYAAIMAGTGAPYTMFSQPMSFSISPAITADTAEATEFMVENWDNTTGKLKLWELTGSVSSPTMTAIGYPETTTLWNSSASGGDFLPQVGTPNKMDGGDDRITRSVMKNGSVWCSHTVFFPASGTTTHSSVMWWQLDTAANPVQNGLINDATATVDYAYPSIAVNAANDFMIGCGYFSHSVYASCAYALHLHTDPADSIRTPVVYRHGQAYYYATFGGAKDRWGDYSATSVDPRNDTDFWTIQETTLPGTSPNWDTWWASVQYCPKPLPPTMASIPAAPCSGSNVTYAIDTVAGATSYVWTISGAGWSGTAGTDSFYAVGGTGVATISVVAYNGCGEGEAQVFFVTPKVPPTYKPVVSVYLPACIGTPTATFVATATGATGFAWTALDSGWSGTSSVPGFVANVGTGTGMIICAATNACGSGPADTTYVTPLAAPSVAPTVASTSVVCAGSPTATFSATSTGSFTYNWSAFDSGWSGTGTGASFLANAGTGTGMIVCSASNACGNGPNDTLYVTPIATPTASYDVMHHVVADSTNDTITYTGSAPAGATYSWNFGGGTATPGTGAGPQVVQWPTTGLKTVTLSVENDGCTSTVFSDTVLVIEGTHINAVRTVNAPGSNIFIAPNPNDGNFDVIIDGLNVQEVAITVTDMQGRILIRKTAAGNVHKVGVDATALASGTYLVEILADGSLSAGIVTVRHN